MKDRVIGIDFGGTKINFVSVVNGNLEKIYKMKTGKINSKEDIIKKILEGIAHFKKEYKAIGIGIAGLINHKNGEAVFLTNLGGIKHFPIKKMLEEIINKPVHVENDVNVALFGESRVGAMKNKKDGLFVSVGTGIGGAIMLSRKLYTGRDGFAGEFGHITVKENGLKCGCGKRGCIETIASGTGIERYVKSRLKNKSDKLSAEKIVTLAIKGEPLAVDAIETATRYLARVGGNLINIFNPEIIIFGGGVMDSKYIFDRVVSKIPKYALPAFLENTVITRSVLKNNAGAIGAALLATELEEGKDIYV